jgi:hypothetical protein
VSVGLKKRTTEERGTERKPKIIETPLGQEGESSKNMSCLEMRRKETL